MSTSDLVKRLRIKGVLLKDDEDAANTIDSYELALHEARSFVRLFTTREDHIGDIARKTAILIDSTLENNHK